MLHMMNNSRSQIAASLAIRFSVFAMALLLAACSEKPPVVEDIRPVRAAATTGAVRPEVVLVTKLL